MRDFVVRRVGIEPMTLVLKVLMPRDVTQPDKGVFLMRM